MSEKDDVTGKQKPDSTKKEVTTQSQSKPQSESDKQVKSSKKVTVARDKSPQTETAADKAAKKSDSEKVNDAAGESADDSVTSQSSATQSSVTSNPKTATSFFTAEPAPKLSKPRASKGGKGLTLVLVVLFLIAAAGFAWTSYNQYQMDKDWAALQAELKRAASEQALVAQNARETAQSSSQAVNSNQRTIQQQNQQISQLTDALTATQERVRELSGRQQQDWMLAEVEYLIKLAEYKITLESDKWTAIGLLKTADQKLAEIADNSLLELRQAIAKDIASLQLVVAPDISGIVSQLDAIGSQVAGLELLALQYQPPQKTTEPVTDEKAEFNWKAVYTDFLDDFVTTKVHDEPVKPLMTPEQRGNLNANIQLALQQAQIAALRGEQGLYESTLSDAADWLATFFVDNEAAKAMLSNIENLKQIRVTMDLPAKLDAKQTIKGINQQRLYQWLEETPGNSVTVNGEAAAEDSQ